MEPVNGGVMQKKFNALSIHQPADETQGIFSFQGREKGSCPQDVSLGSTFDDQNFCGETFEVRASPAQALENTGLVSSEMDTFRSKRQGRSSPPDGR
jgi:hypothetical protein